MKTIKRTLALSIAALFAALWLIPVCASAKGGAPAHVWWDGSNASWSVPEDDEPADHYEVYVRECAIDDVAEIDTFEDLQAIDPSYLSYQKRL